MAEIYSQAPIPFIPDNLTIPQFFLDYHHPLRPVREATTPIFIDDDNGRKIGLEEVRLSSSALSMRKLKAL